MNIAEVLDKGVAVNPVFTVFVYRNVEMVPSAKNWGESKERYTLKIVAKRGQCVMLFRKARYKLALKLVVDQSTLVAVHDSARFFLLRFDAPLGIGFPTKDESTAFVVEYMKKMYEAHNYKGKRRIFGRRPQQPLSQSDGHHSNHEHQPLTPKPQDAHEMGLYDRLEGEYVAAINNKTTKPRPPASTSSTPATPNSRHTSESRPALLRAAASRADLLGTGSHQHTPSVSPALLSTSPAPQQQQQQQQQAPVRSPEEQKRLRTLAGLDLEGRLDAQASTRRFAARAAQQQQDTLNALVVSDKSVLLRCIAEVRRELEQLDEHHAADVIANSSTEGMLCGRRGSEPPPRYCESDSDAENTDDDSEEVPVSCDEDDVAVLCTDLGADDAAAPLSPTRQRCHSVGDGEPL